MKICAQCGDPIKNLPLVSISSIGSEAEVYVHQRRCAKIWSIGLLVEGYRHPLSGPETRRKCAEIIDEWAKMLGIRA